MNVSFSVIQLTALVGTAIFGHTVIQGLLFPEVVLICFAVSARTRTYPTLKWPSSQHLTTAEMIGCKKISLLGNFCWNLGSLTFQIKSKYVFTIQRIPCLIQKEDPYLNWYKLCISDSLPGFQSDDDEDGSPVHATHTAAVAHEVIQDGGKLSPHLKHKAVNPTNKWMLKDLNVVGLIVCLVSDTYKGITGILWRNQFVSIGSNANLPSYSKCDQSTIRGQCCSAVWCDVR